MKEANSGAPVTAAPGDATKADGRTRFGGSPGDVLGLGNYGSDADDEDNEIESSSVPTPATNAAYQSGIKQPLANTHDVTRASDLSHSSKVVPEDLRDNGLDAIQRSHDKFNGFSSKDTSRIPRSELLGKSIGGEKATDDHSGRESRRKFGKNDRPATSDRDASTRQLKTHSSVPHQQDTDAVGLNLTTRVELL
ncbi:hypothetical protein VIGAN_01112700 [Vigna angularis var. angularis]|nr:hypothetical protein VIGAN_01112700 [Vigna angularis var. angularis]